MVITATIRSDPKTLLDTCVEYFAQNIDNILDENDGLFRQLPATVCDLISDKILKIGAIHDVNYRKILNGKTRNVVFWKDKCSGIKHPVGFLQHLQDVCMNVVKIDLEALSPYMARRDTKMIGNALASMVHLEWVNLKDCRVKDDCLRYIGSKCTKLKHLNISGCHAITKGGIQGLCDPGNIHFGKCTQLTHVDFDGHWATPRQLSLFLLHCPNLVDLWYPLNTVAVAEAILELSGEDTNDWRPRYDDDDDVVLIDEFGLLFDKVPLCRSIDCVSFEPSS